MIFATARVLLVPCQTLPTLPMPFWARRTAEHGRARARTHRRFLRSVLSPGVRVSLHRDSR